MTWIFFFSFPLKAPSENKDGVCLVIFPQRHLHGFPTSRQMSPRTFSLSNLVWFSFSSAIYIVLSCRWRCWSWEVLFSYFSNSFRFLSYFSVETTFSWNIWSKTIFSWKMFGWKVFFGWKNVVRKILGLDRWRQDLGLHCLWRAQAQVLLSRAASTFT